MNPLRKLQAEFSEAVIGRMDDSIDYGIVPNGLSAERRMQVYKNNMYTSLTEALMAVFPVVNRLVGEEFFRHAAKQYIPLYPSRSGDLHDFGGDFPQFLGSLEATASLPYLVDVAELEWAYHMVFHGAHAQPLDMEQLQKLPAHSDNDLHFTLNPACRLIRSEYPILKIWLSNQEHYEGNDSISLHEGGVALAVLRPELEIEFHVLAEGDYLLLTAINDGAPFFAACEQAVQVEPDMDIAASLLGHIQRKIIVDFFVNK